MILVSGWVAQLKRHLPQQAGPVGRGRSSVSHVSSLLKASLRLWCVGVLKPSLATKVPSLHTSRRRANPTSGRDFGPKLTGAAGYCCYTVEVLLSARNINSVRTYFSNHRHGPRLISNE